MCSVHGFSHWVSRDSTLCLPVFSWRPLSPRFICPPSCSNSLLDSSQMSQMGKQTWSFKLGGTLVCFSFLSTPCILSLLPPNLSWIFLLVYRCSPRQRVVTIHLFYCHCFITGLLKSIVLLSSFSTLGAFKSTGPVTSPLPFQRCFNLFNNIWGPDSSHGLEGPVWSHWHHRCLSSPPLHSATLTLTWYDSHVGAFVFSLSFLWNAFPLPHLVYSCLSWAQLRFFYFLKERFLESQTKPQMCYICSNRATVLSTSLTLVHGST